MNGPELEITISKAGQVMVEIRGAKGPRCLKYAELLGEIVGREAQRRLTREYYEPDTEVRAVLDVRQGRGDSPAK